MIGLFFNQVKSKKEEEVAYYSWKAKVIYDEGYASFLFEYINRPEYNGRGGFVGMAPWSEVIGNIHENEELLK